MKRALHRFSALSAAHRHRPGAKPPVIVCSAVDGLRETIDAARRSGSAACVVQPLRQTVILDTLACLLSGDSTSR